MGAKRVSLVSILLVLLIAILLTTLYFYPSQENTAPNKQGWRMMYGNPQGTNVGDYNTSHLTGKILWGKNFKHRIKGLLGYGNNTLYALVGNNLISLDSRGNIRWESKMKFSSVVPAVDEYGNIYAAAGGNIVSLDKDGHIRWKYPLEGNERVGTPIIVRDERVYIITNSGTLYVLNNMGKRILTVSLERGTDIPPVLSPTGSIYAGINNSVYKISSWGDIEWHLNLDGEILRMAFYEDRLYVTTLKVVFSPYPVVENITPYLFSISQDGRIEGRLDLNKLGAQWGAPIGLAVQSSIYVAITPTALPSGGYSKNTSLKVQNHSFIMKFDAQGHLIWKKGFYKVIEGLTVSRDGFIYATFSAYEQMGNEYCKIYSLNQKGEALWSKDLEFCRYSISLPVIGPEIIYVYGGNYLCAIV